MLAKMFRDPVYEYISVTTEELRLIDSPWVQRLRHCSQNGPAKLVYPSLLGTRFEHSLGVMELGDKVLRSVLDRTKYYDPGVIDRFLTQCVRDFAVFLGRKIDHESAQDQLLRLFRMACLCHDLGHFPLSHTVEKAFEQEFWLHAVPQYWINKRACHEAVSAEVLRQLAYEYDPHVIDDYIARGVILVLLAPPDVSALHDGARITFEQSVFSTLSSILMGDYDVDRLDYLQRDGRISGAGCGDIDLDRFVESMMLVESGGQFQVMPTSKALSTVETVLLERYKEYKWVVFHHKVTLFNELTVEIARDILADRAIREKLFCKCTETEPSADVYREEMLGSLGDPGKQLPPLNLYRGSDLKLPPGAYSLNGRYFVDNDHSYLLDDVWFCLRFRSLCRASEEGRIYVAALVDRKKCALTLWKDLSQFRGFRNECTSQAGISVELRELANKEQPDTFPELASDWLKRLWAAMREEETFGESSSDALSEAIQGKLRRAKWPSVRVLMVPLHWSRLFGRLENKLVMGRRGSPVSLLENSNLLSRLAGLDGEIPFYLYAIGPEREIGLLNDSTTEEERLRIAAAGFIQGVISCWNDPATPEFRGLWREVTRPV